MGMRRNFARGNTRVLAGFKPAEGFLQVSSLALKLHLQKMELGITHAGTHAENNVSRHLKV